ncbi:hypothetical protein F5141DRAFT_1083369 [Pisolithus sp. B1]|nr:hypothetical protein F5141DRAFT_1083369 [Pisolithus sp. B1]
MLLKVMTGQNADETGLVVSVSDNVVTFVSDMTMQEVSVFSKDRREAAEVGTGTNIVGNYELHDLVQLDLQTVGVIFKTERDSFRVLDQNGQVRLVQPHQISMRRDSLRAIATDSEGHELRVNDNVREIEGEVCPEAYVIVLGTNVTSRIGRDGCYIFTNLSLHSSTTVMYPKMEASL